MYDVVLTGGHVVDGSGLAPFVADVAVSDGRIVAVGDLAGSEAADRVDVSGLAVAPGFIDLHTHSDFTLLVNGRAESQVHQGVTTEVVGQCGASVAPVSCCDDIAHGAVGYSESCGVELDWQTFGEYLDRLDAVPLGVNVAAFVGHGAIHRAVMGDALGAPQPDDIEQMNTLLEASFEQGAYGFSTGLEYWPGSNCAPEHILPLVRTASRNDRLYATHVRNRDTWYDLGFGEALATARNAGARLQISHIQPKYGAPPHAMHHTLEMVDGATRHGTDVAFDVIPHDWNHTLVMAILPPWALEGGVLKVLERLADPVQRERMKRNQRHMWLLVTDGCWDRIAILNSEVNNALVGNTIEEIAAARGVAPFDAVLDLLVEEGERMSGLLWTSSSFTESEIELCLGQASCAVISDTLALAPYGALEKHLGSISGYGWAARFLGRYSRDKALLPLSEAVRRMSSLPAERLGLNDRGQLRPGYRADITVFDASEIESRCSIETPRAYASGIAHVLVNGEFCMRAGKRTESNPGEVLRPH